MARNYWTLAVVLIMHITLASASARGDAGAELQLNTYTHDGELAQIAFASRGVRKSSPAVGFVLDDVGVLMSCGPRPSLLAQRTDAGIEVMDNIGFCPVGWKSDCLRLKSEWRQVVEGHKFQFGEAPSVDMIASRLSTFMTRGLYQERSDAFARPLAASVLFIEHSPEERRNRLVLLENSGAVYQCHFLACTGSISSSQSDVDAIEALIFGGGGKVDKRDLRDIIKSVAAKLIKHVKGKFGGGGDDDESDDFEVEIECCIMKASASSVGGDQNADQVDALGGPPSPDVAAGPTSRVFVAGSVESLVDIIELQNLCKK